MDYIFNEMQMYVEVARNNKERTRCRLLAYVTLLQPEIFGRSIEKERSLVAFLIKKVTGNKKYMGK